jgi:hypothetical protein
MKEVKVTIPGIEPGQVYEITVALKDDQTGRTVGYGTRTLRGKSSSPYTTTVKVGE